MAVPAPRLIRARHRFAACVLASSALGFVGCQRPAPLPPATSPDPDAPIEGVELDSGEGAGATADERPVCVAGGQPWEGRADGCLYEVKGCCYGSPAEACTAAGCPEGECQIIEVRPAQITCQ